MITQQMWTYIGWVLLIIFVLSIAALTYALYRDYQLTKNKKTALPSLDVVETTEQKSVFVGDESIAADTPVSTANKIPSRRSLRGAKAQSAPSAPVVSAAPSAFFDDDEEFTLTAGQD